MSAFPTFQTISNFKINLSKSEILNINLPRAEAASQKPFFPFKWEQTHMKYLGIFLTPKLHSLFKYNYIPLLNSIKEDLRKWASLSHSWLGKINIIKMNILPRILFLFQMIPLGVPVGFFTILQAMVSRFVWRNSHPRISRDILFRSKCSGGLALPNFKTYYHAVILSRLTDWKYALNSKLWVQIEYSLE